MDLVNAITMALVGTQMGIVTHFGRLALLLCLPSDSVHRELQRLTTTNVVAERKTKVSSHSGVSPILWGRCRLATTM